ncbi:hypothetical protein, partial [Metabacillus fastidiosus]|uniref:hypothetical protein n=1 Tax=Metabacillus fastidiosus TaxID=1458 RepID=UPI003D26E751
LLKVFCCLTLNHLNLLNHYSLNEERNTKQYRNLTVASTESSLHNKKNDTHYLSIVPLAVIEFSCSDSAIVFSFMASVSSIRIFISNHSMDERTSLTL